MITPSPQMVKRAATMTIIECHERRKLFHVVTIEKRTHDVQLSAIGGGAICDCEASQRGVLCAHALAVKWFTAFNTTNNKTKDNNN